MIKAAKELKVIQINKEPSKMGDQFNVGDQIVRIFKKPGRSLITCTCENHTRFCNSPVLCKHKLAVIKFIMKEELKKFDKKGYILIYKPNHSYSKTKKGWIYEHRSVVEDFIKRNLKPHECIHHVDEDKTNNKIENLMIFRSHKEHSKFHTKIKQFGFTNPILRQIENRWKNIK